MSTPALAAIGMLIMSNIFCIIVIVICKLANYYLALAQIAPTLAQIAQES